MKIPDARCSIFSLRGGGGLVTFPITLQRGGGIIPIGGGGGELGLIERNVRLENRHTYHLVFGKKIAKSTNTNPRTAAKLNIDLLENLEPKTPPVNLLLTLRTNMFLLQFLQW